MECAQGMLLYETLPFNKGTEKGEEIGRCVKAVFQPDYATSS